MYKVSIIPALLLVLGACGLNANNFDDRFAEELCKAYQECQAVYFNEYYDNVRECTDAITGYYGGDYYADCDFDRKAAKDCLKRYKSFRRSCEYEDLYDDDSCYMVWSNC